MLKDVETVTSVADSVLVELIPRPEIAFKPQIFTVSLVVNTAGAERPNLMLDIISR